jgi:hypothetical protein
MEGQFTPKYLTADQIGQLYGDALTQAEAQVTNAWINLQLAPHDPARQAVFTEQTARLRALEEDHTRLCPPDPEATKPGFAKTAEERVAERAK